MLQYLKSEYMKAQQKLEYVSRTLCLQPDVNGTLIGGEMVLSPMQEAAVAWQLKPFETMVGLWQGRVLEAELIELHEPSSLGVPIIAAVEAYAINNEVEIIA